MHREDEKQILRKELHWLIYDDIGEVLYIEKNLCVRFDESNNLNIE
jgi:hypothetical protein